MNRPNARPGYNAKARQSTAGQRKKGKRSRAAASVEDNVDSNAIIVTPKSDEQKELDRRARLRQQVHTFGPSYPLLLTPPLCLQLIAESESKVNSKKRKRLEKYIVRSLHVLCFPFSTHIWMQEKKLKQEERVALFEKLSYASFVMSKKEFTKCLLDKAKHSYHLL